MRKLVKGGDGVQSNSSLFVDENEWHFGQEDVSGHLSVQNRLEMIEMKRENMKHIEQGILLFNSGKPKVAFAYLAEQGIISSEEEEELQRTGSHESVVAALSS